jgi:hypothetical protein
MPPAASEAVAGFKKNMQRIVDQDGSGISKISVSHNGRTATIAERRTKKKTSARAGSK